MITLLSTSSFSISKDSEKVNEDSILAPVPISDGYLFAVADGVGSYQGANSASSIAISALMDLNSVSIESIGIIFSNARDRIIELGKNSPELSKAATTLTFCYVIDNGLFIGHIGDCRLYVADSKKLYQLTHDDTRHQMLIDEGLFTARDLKDKPGKNMLTTAIASNVEMEFDSLFIPFDELPVIDGVITLYVMSDGAHHFWEKRPRFTENTMKSVQKFSSGLIRRIERNGPVDDYSVVGISLRIN